MIKKEDEIRTEKPKTLEDRFQSSEAMLWETWGLMLSSGTPILQSLNILKKTFPAYEKLVQGMHDGIKEGEGVISSIEKYASDVKINPSALTYLHVGEEIGSLPEMCNKLSELLLNQDICGKEDENSKRAREKIGFYTCLNDLVDNGLPLLTTLKIMKDSSNYLPKEVYTQIDVAIRHGNTLAEALAEYPQYIDSIEISILKAGEETGTLPEIFKRLSGFVRDEAQLEYKPYSEEEKGKIRFYRRLSEMINVGFPLLVSLHEVGKNTKYPSIEVINGLSEAIASGNTLSEAWGQYPEVFTPLEINMMRVGECSGVPEVVLDRMSNYFIKSAEFKYR
jgi:type II secretory pathway component PulF